MNRILITHKPSNERSCLLEKLKSETLSVITAESKEEIIELVRNGKIDIWILDLILRDFDSIFLLRELTELKIKIPHTIMLSENCDDYTQLIALESGADDFLIKPIQPMLIKARIDAVLGRKKGMKENDNVQGNKFVVDSERHLILLNSKKVELPKKQFDLLKLFYENPGKMFTRKEISRKVWNVDDVILKSRSIDTQIRNIRKVVGDEIIKSVKGVGYGLGYCNLTSDLFSNMNE